jgi:hypothetical protein
MIDHYTINIFMKDVDDTNCPITEAPPPALSSNWISDTMI